MGKFNNIDNPKISIIMPVYNVKQYIKEALDSVINQTYKNLEIIVVDDGSNDGSEIICEEYAQKDNRIKLIHQENGGLSAARNTGLDNMTGDYFAFFDSDDIFSSNAIEKSISAMLYNDVDCVVFKYIFCKIPKNYRFKTIPKGKKHPNIASGKYYKREILNAIANREMGATVWNKLTKRNIWNNIRFPENHNYEDRYVIFKIFDKIKTTYIIDDILILYRKRNGSISNGYTIKTINDILDSWDIFESYVKNTPEIFNNEQLKRTQEKILIDLLYHYVKALSKRMPEKSKILELLRKRIIDMSATIKIKNSGIENKLIYFLISNHSEVLSICFPTIFAIYINLKKILGIS